MPLHRIYAPPNTFSKTDKQELSKRITALYQEPTGLPAFYVVVLFIDVEAESFYVGGQSTDKFVRITTQHIARGNCGEAYNAVFIERLEKAWEPYIKDRGLHWEMHIEFVDRDVWRAEGLRPPMPDTPAEKAWAKENRAISDEELRSMGVI